LRSLVRKSDHKGNEILKFTAGAARDFFNAIDDNLERIAKRPLKKTLDDDLLFGRVSLDGPHDVEFDLVQAALPRTRR
jgi:hypothetical protein